MKTKIILIILLASLISISAKSQIEVISFNNNENITIKVKEKTFKTDLTLISEETYVSHEVEIKIKENQKLSAIETYGEWRNTTHYCEIDYYEQSLMIPMLGNVKNSIIIIKSADRGQIGAVTIINNDNEKILVSFLSKEKLIIDLKVLFSDDEKIIIEIMI